MFDKKPTFLFGFIVGAILGSGPVILRELGMFPANHDPILLPILLVQFGFTSFFGALAGLTGSSMMADIADEHEMNTGLRQEGIF